MDQLPQHGEWHLSNNVLSADPPFAVLTVDFRGWTGTARYLRNTVTLGKVERIAKDQFRAHYSVNGNVGIFEAVYRDDQTLRMTFYGSVETTCVARPISLVGGERPVAAWSTGEKVQASIERALPLLPADVAHEIKMMLTPSAVAIMAGVLAVWGASHLFGVGEVVDLLLLVTGGVLLGAAALEVAENLVEFARKSTGARSEADLDAAARHFAVAVAKGGVQAVLAILMWRGLRGARPRVGRPAAPGEPPTNLNAVAPSRIPAASRASAALTEMGEQPRLGGLAREVAEAARAAINRLRRADVENGVDCWGASMEVREVAGGAGQAMESNAASPIAGWDHTMWVVGEEVVDLRPGGWRSHFERFPERLAAIERAVPGLAKRLKEGAVMTMDEFRRYMGVRTAPRSPMFSTEPVPAPRRGG
ncbi:MAG: hypothetical protein DYH06_14870 [Acidobacteria bacterium ACB2]|nr:hypothetical protein [Acidobacteria bacterium ACB2]